MDVLFDGAGFIFAFRVLPAIIFVTALISLLYYIGVMGLLIRILGDFPEGAEHQQDRIVRRRDHDFPRAE
jgi:nucleoside permease NupC